MNLFIILYPSRYFLSIYLAKYLSISLSIYLSIYRINLSYKSIFYEKMINIAYKCGDIYKF